MGVSSVIAPTVTTPNIGHPMSLSRSSRLELCRVRLAYLLTDGRLALTEPQTLHHDPAAAPAYVNFLKQYLDRNVLINYVAVGNEVTAAWYNRQYEGLSMPALINIQRALEAAGLRDRVKLVVPLDLSILSNSYPPSGI
jgi:hypothetical protein